MCDGIDEEFVPWREPARLPISSVLSKEYAQRCMHIQYLGLNFGCEGCPITQSTPDPEVTYWQTKIQSSEPSGLGSQFGVPEFLRSDLLRELSGLLGVPECRRSVLVEHWSANVVQDADVFSQDAASCSDTSSSFGVRCGSSMYVKACCGVESRGLNCISCIVAISLTCAPSISHAHQIRKNTVNSRRRRIVRSRLRSWTTPGASMASGFRGGGAMTPNLITVKMKAVRATANSTGTVLGHVVARDHQKCVVAEIKCDAALDANDSEVQVRTTGGEVGPARCEWKHEQHGARWAFKMTGGAQVQIGAAASTDLIAMEVEANCLSIEPPVVGPHGPHNL